MAKRKNARGHVRIIVNNVEIEGWQYADGWYWGCDAFPEIATDFDKSETASGAIERFMALVLRRAVEVKKAIGTRRCRVCGCTDADCRQCIVKTGRPCHWVEADLCSACVPAAAGMKVLNVKWRRG